MKRDGRSSRRPIGHSGRAQRARVRAIRFSGDAHASAPVAARAKSRPHDRGLALVAMAAAACFGALGVHLSRRAGGDRLTSLTAALSPSIVMVPLWIAVATRMSHPSPRQWFGLLCGVLNWIIAPGVALSLGAWSLLSTRTKKNMNTHTMNTRTRTFWVPALVSLTTAMACLTISTLGGLEPRFIARGWATYVVYIPWLLTLPLCGAAGAYLSRRAGGERQTCLAAGLFPVIAMTSLVGFPQLSASSFMPSPSGSISRWQCYSAPFFPARRCFWEQYRSQRLRECSSDS